jgi:hypothetical protein
MSEKTGPALAKLDELLPLLRALPANPDSGQLIESAEALRRAVAAFHMEAIRFRMYSVDRLLIRQANDDCSRLFGEVRQALETAGFHTRSHAAP